MEYVIGALACLLCDQEITQHALFSGIQIPIIEHGNLALKSQLFPSFVS